MRTPHNSGHFNLSQWVRFRGVPLYMHSVKRLTEELSMPAVSKILVRSLQPGLSWSVLVTSSLCWQMWLCTGTLISWARSPRARRRGRVHVGANLGATTGSISGFWCSNNNNNTLYTTNNTQCAAVASTTHPLVWAEQHKHTSGFWCSHACKVFKDNISFLHMITGTSVF